MDDFSRPWPKGAEELPSFATKRQVNWRKASGAPIFASMKSCWSGWTPILAKRCISSVAAAFFNNSWIILTADHGDMAGEHNLPFKGPYMYEGVVRVPFIIVPPRPRFSGPWNHSATTEPILPGRRKQICSLIDLVPTILDLASVEIPSSLPGRSLLPVIRMPRHRPVVRMFFPSIIARPSGCVVPRTGNMFSTSTEKKNSITSRKTPMNSEIWLLIAAHKEMKADLRTALEAHLTQTGDPFHHLKDHEFIFNPSKI